MKRIISFLLTLVLVLTLAPAVLADVIWIPEDPFLNKHMGDCGMHDRSYYAAGPDGEVIVYESPESSVVAKKLENGERIHISWDYTDENGIVWGFCEHWGEDHITDWTGWMPLDHLLLRYDYISFKEEFADRLVAEGGILEGYGGQTIRAWSYPGSEGSYDLEVYEEYGPDYGPTFIDDAGRKWGFCSYYMSNRTFWMCLDDPTADYDTLYAEHEPQQVTHPVKDITAQPVEIKPQGMSLNGILAAVCVIAILSGGFLWMTRKKK